MRAFLNALLAFVLLALLTAAVLGINWLDGAVTITLPDQYGLGQEYTIEASLGMMAFLLLIMMALVAIITRLVAALMDWPRRWRRRRTEKKREAGHRALTQGLVAIAAGDAELARKKAKQAARLLNQPALSLLLSAQAAELSGDMVEAARFYQLLSQNPEAGFLGLRGQLQHSLPQALRSGDGSAARVLLDTAKKMQPRSQFVLQSEMELAARQGRFNDVRKIVRDMQRAKALPQTLLRRHEAASLLGASMMDTSDKSFQDARNAFQLDPEFTPTAQRYAEMALLRDDKKLAARIIEKSWRLEPHPALLKLWDKCAPHKPGHNALNHYQWLHRLTRLRPDHYESKLALGQAAMRAGLWGEARKLLVALHEKGGPSGNDARLYRTLSELELAERSDRAAADSWHEQIAAARPDALWVCDECGHATRQWHPVCSQCGHFDKFDWRVPVRAITPLPATV